MQFLPNGPDIPTELVSAQERGQTIFVCGAGVSLTVGLPSFRGLVECVYKELGEDWKLHVAEREGMEEGGELYGQYDRVLRCLERRLVASNGPRNRGMRDRIRTAVRNALVPPDNVSLANHLSLLELSRDDEGNTRLLTTNFDTLFERAWFEDRGNVVPSHVGMAIPQPKTARCVGVLHLHGRLADVRTELKMSDESDLVLTSAEFGDAYLRSGWASRYVYDLVRAYTVVLVGYQADDPPMRYLLEVLEADRERYPDLQKVYAFAPSKPGEEERNHALWKAKGVDPILYTVNGGDHANLYSNLREWRQYAQDPTAWRRGQLRQILNENSGVPVAISVQKCADLLVHGDAFQILGELSPMAAWLPALLEKRISEWKDSLPGEWIAKRINDADMIRACAGLAFFDDRARWHINQALEHEKTNLSPVRLKAWKLILLAKLRRSDVDPEDSWYQVVKSVKNGSAGFEVRRLVCRIFQPRLEVKKAFQWGREIPTPDTPEALHQFMQLDFVVGDHLPAEEILSAWPLELDHEIALFRNVDRALVEALEAAEDVGFLSGYDRADSDVPSVGLHKQNHYRSGFYPIIRLLADLWSRIAARNVDYARLLAMAWADSHFLLIKRLSIFAFANNAFTPHEATTAVLKLDDRTFWASGAQVEIMRVLAGRWMEFDLADRPAVESRLRGGIPRELFPNSAIENEEEWVSIHDSSIYRRLKRIEAAGGVLAAESHKRLAEISVRQPKWKPGTDDRDDFSSWSESSSGPSAHPELLADVVDENLVKEALRLQRERHFEEGDIWRVFCSVDPERALRGLQIEANSDRWEAIAWRDLLWAASSKDDPNFQFELADSILKMPADALLEILGTATSWLQTRRETLSQADRVGGSRFFLLWDRFADLAYRVGERSDTSSESDNDLLTQALNRPGGVLAWALLDSLGALKPLPGSGLGSELKPRFDLIAIAAGQPGLLARVYLGRFLAYLDASDPAWVMEKLIPRFSWGDPEALAMWGAYSQGGLGSARLFNALKSSMLQAFARNDFSDHEFEGLFSRLLSVALWHQRGQELEYNLTTSEIKRALLVGPSVVRKNASWNFWRMMGEEQGDPADRAIRWRQIVGPLFRDIWPLDAGLRHEQTARNFVLMSLECEGAFPEAVDAIIDFVVPYQLYRLSHSLRLETKHDRLVSEHPVAFLRLANALIDPTAYPVPSDLAVLLQECVNANPSVRNEPAYVRLFGLSRQINA